MRTRFALIGRGWRADFYLRLAAALPEQFEIAAMATRDADRGSEIEAQWGIETVRTVDELIRREPDFVVTSVPREANPGLVQSVVTKGIPVLSETPPAADVQTMRTLWEAVGDSALVQVAEQYPYLPRFQAIRALIHDGALGAVTSAQVAWTHGYHQIALLRALLGVGFGPAEITAARFTAPALRSLGRAGWPEEEAVDMVEQVIATLDFGDRFGVYDFTIGQWFHPLMRRRVAVRGTYGEVVDDVLTSLTDVRTSVSSPLMRRQTSIDGDLEGFDLDTVSLNGHVLYRNPYAGARLSDEEIAVATFLDRMGAWVRGDGPEPYSLANACQDHLLSLAIDTAAGEGRRVSTATEAWAR